MRLPIRRSERLKTGAEDGPFYLTKEGLQKLKQRLKTIEEQELPQSIEDVRITAEFGDFSENAEYQEAKARMRRLHGQVINIKEKMKRVVLIQTDTSQEVVQLGSTVVLKKTDSLNTFQIVGPHETDPARGRISYLSPLGSRLMGHKIGETVSGYTLIQIRS